MTIIRRRKLSEEELAEGDNNMRDEEDLTSQSDLNTVQVPLSAIRHQIGRILEFFIIIQFTIGALIFFTGIFLLSWAVTPGTAFKAGSYMLLAGLVIGRSLLGLVGIHPGRSGALFAYGSLLMGTCILRTIMILVSMKILMGAERFAIPPLLTAAPGALSPSIELICAVIEASQAICAFYVAWIIDKQSDAEKDYNDQQLEAVLINLRAIQKKRHYSGFSRKSQASNLSQKNHIGLHTNKHETNNQNNQAHQPTQAEIDYFAVYKRYPRNTPTPTIPKSPKPAEIEQDNEEPEIQEEEEEGEVEEETIHEVPEKVEEKTTVPVKSNKRHLPKRPFTLDYAPVTGQYPFPPQTNHEQIEQTNQISLPVKTGQPYYPQYREPYAYYDTVAKTPPEIEMDYQFDPYSQANSPLLMERRNFYGSTGSRPANEFQYSAFNSHYP